MFKPCNHWFVDGFGAMGDAMVCRFCGLDKYPEVVPVQTGLATMLGRVTSEGDADYSVHFVEAVAARKTRRLAAEQNPS